MLKVKYCLLDSKHISHTGCPGRPDGPGRPSSPLDPISPLDPGRPLSPGLPGRPSNPGVPFSPLAPLLHALHEPPTSPVRQCVHCTYSLFVHKLHLKYITLIISNHTFTLHFLFLNIIVIHFRYVFCNNFPVFYIYSLWYLSTDPCLLGFQGSHLVLGCLDNLHYLCHPSDLEDPL